VSYLLGETRKFTYVETKSVAYAPTSPDVTVIKSDGTTVSPDTSATVSPGTSNITQTFTSSAVLLDLSGLWKRQWEYTADGSIYKPTEYFFVTFTDIAHYVRLLLQQTLTTVTDEFLDVTVARIIKLIEIQFPLLPSYKTN
jgi:hypothetical protein